MKQTFLRGVFAVVFSLICSGCGKDNSVTVKSDSFREGTFSKDASYALGMDIGNSFKADNLYPNLDEFFKGINDVLNDGQPRYTREEAQRVFQEAYEAVKRKPENEYLAESSKKQGVIVTVSGLQYEVITEGTGPKPTASDTVLAHYEGTLTDGTVFDSSYNRGEPAEFSLNMVIAGWTEGLQLMSVGSKYRFIIPSDLGYGPQGAGPQIPPFSTLIFEVELLDIIKEEMPE